MEAIPSALVVVCESVCVATIPFFVSVMEKINGVGGAGMVLVAVFALFRADRRYTRRRKQRA